MLRRARDLDGYKLGARDGEIGKVKEFYFDDRSWIIRYLIADTGGWLSGKRVLISPFGLDAADDDGKVIPVDLTRSQIENSPAPITDRPVSRQFERDYYTFYGWPVYWGGPHAWGLGSYPIRAKHQSSVPSGAPEDEDPHLRSTKDVTGRDIQAQDGAIGHVEDFVIDTETWAIRYLIVDTGNWWPGRMILISTRWIDRISWEESKVFINLTRDAIKQEPEYNDDTVITRDYEANLHRCCGREGYWAEEPTEPVVLQKK